MTTAKLRDYAERHWVTVLPALLVMVLAASGAQGATCSDCHGMPPIDAAYRNVTSGGFKGSHMTHNPASAAASNCEPCHTGASSYAVDHRDGVIKIASNLNNSPVAAVYSKGTFFNQTSIPVMGSCSNVNCHFEAVTPAWGNSPFTSPASCGACHGAPPSDGNHPALTGAGKKHGDYYGTGTASCVKCHSDHTAEATPFAHATSAGKRSLVVAFTSAPNAGGSYSGNVAYPNYLPSQNPTRNGSCSSLYCHSNGAGGAPVTVPVWGSTLAADCTGCHGNDSTSASAIASGKHTAHINNAAVFGTGNNFGCVECHAKTVSGNRAVATMANHVNGMVDYSGARAGGSARYSATTKVCSNIYCHSNGNAASLVYVAPPAWNSTGTLACNGCHGTSNATTGAPDYTNGGAGTTTANSHAKHVSGATDTTICATCHQRTASATVGGRFKDYSASLHHLNRTPNVYFDSTKAGTTATWTQASTTCSNVACHGGSGSSVTWGSTLNCQDCHGNGASASVADFGATFWNNGTMSKFQLTGTGSFADTGHGRPTASGNYPGSANPPANFAGITNYCEWCHDSTIGHNVSTNPFRLRNWADATWGKNGNCMLCHATASAGVTVGGQLRNGTKKVGSYHYGAKHSTSLSGGQFCWDCHDAHGTGTTNQYMMRPYPALASDPTTGALTSLSATAAVFTLSATPTGTDFAKSAAPFNGICNVCHTTTSHYTIAAGDGHNSGTVCTSCHLHTTSTAATGFTPTGGDCTTCHASQQGTGTRQVVGTDTVLASHHIKVGTTLNPASCTVCHEQAVFGHQVAGDVAVGMFNQDTGAALTYDGTTATASNLETSCNSCHDANGASRLGANAMKPFADSGDNTAPPFIDWSTGKQAHSAQMACFNCHGNSAGVAGNTLNPTYNAHGSATAKMLQHPYSATDTMTTTTNFCYNCHGTTTAGGVVSPSIQAAVNLSTTIGHKSANCSACHDQHSAKPGTHVIGPSSPIAPVLNGVTGVGSWPATSPAIATTWNGTGTLAVTYSAKPAATNEFEICFKCHAGSVPAPTGYTTGALRMTDLGLEFNPNNKSGHPVVASLNNYAGSTAPKALLSTDMVAPWTAIGTQTMTCSDCHGYNGTGAMGPHGSTVKWMLTGTNQAWPFTTVAGNGTSSGTPWMLGTASTGTAPNKLFCLNCHKVVGTNGVHQAVATSGEHTSWASTARAACVSCHIRIPHGGKVSRLMRPGTAAVLGRYAPDGNGNEVGTSTTQVISKFTKGTQTSNRRGSWSSVGCTEHTGGTETW
ncbi:CxxxxCH/CxxCH domain-containing protein [Geomonas sp. Red32]|uniref:CxxxxCH/CxxCH domain c-type cytochrome n=1 Tax=Geomonas sp. Red32 TaxID=2912856 RepID=UPI00202CC35B|nr:CxxxxCH/CxxCH domain-containing protein [Geomonas sp. Red32]MCM0080736.1 CxxxxCH/CxxCH domain-containing protein [Geomonas sp. Red32]